MSAETIPLIAGNWKMHGVKASLGEIEKLGALIAAGPGPRCEIAICPPATLLSELSRTATQFGIATGGQDCSALPNGAHTGDISAAMLADAGARYVILGHSERRADHAETDAQVRAKAVAALAAGLVPIICAGESEAQRRNGEADAVVHAQLAASIPDEAGTAETVIAYEPIWAIGTGLTPTIADIAAMHAGIRAQLAARFAASGKGMRILYGGSLKPVNAREILAVPHVNGGLVGGASLLSNDFYAIISASS